jgi:uncharacterized protein (TIGR03084 family)
VDLKSGLLVDLEREYRALDGVLAAASAAQWRRSTPATGWDVTETVRHLVASETATQASLVDDRDPMEGHLDDGGPGFEPDILLAQWRAASRATLVAFSRLDTARRVPWGGRRMSARSLATARLMETWAHGLDCAAALDAPVVDTDRLAHIAWLGWATLPHAFAIAEETPPAPLGELGVELLSPSGARWSFGPERSSLRLQGDAGVWCRVVTHRWRSPLPPPLKAVGRLAQRAVVVARAFL